MRPNSFHRQLGFRKARDSDLKDLHAGWLPDCHPQGVEENLGVLVDRELIQVVDSSCVRLETLCNDTQDLSVSVSRPDLERALHLLVGHESRSALDQERQNCLAPVVIMYESSGHVEYRHLAGQMDVRVGSSRNEESEKLDLGRSENIRGLLGAGQQSAEQVMEYRLTARRVGVDICTSVEQSVNDLAHRETHCGPFMVRGASKRLGERDVRIRKHGALVDVCSILDEFDGHLSIDSSALAVLLKRAEVNGIKERCSARKGGGVRVRVGRDELREEGKVLVVDCHVQRRVTVCEALSVEKLWELLEEGGSEIHVVRDGEKVDDRQVVVVPMAHG